MPSRIRSPVLIMYRGRGGSSGASFPRRPRPLIGSGSAALPLPWDLGLDELLAVSSLGPPHPITGRRPVLTLPAELARAGGPL